MTPLVLTRKEAAEALKVSVWVIDRLIADGLLPRVAFPSSTRPGESNRRVLISVADLADFVAKHSEKQRNQV